MSRLLDLCAFACFGFVFLAALTLILMHLPNSPLRTIALRGAAGLFACLFAPVYVISPIDVLPEAALGPIGLIDDIAVVLAAIAAGRYALCGPEPADDEGVSEPEDDEDMPRPRRRALRRHEPDDEDE